MAACPSCAMLMRPVDLHSVAALRATLKTPLPAHLRADPHTAVAPGDSPGAGTSSKIRTLMRVCSHSVPCCCGLVLRAFSSVGIVDMTANVLGTGSYTLLLGNCYGSAWRSSGRWALECKRMSSLCVLAERPVTTQCRVWCRCSTMSSASPTAAAALPARLSTRRP
jgi:hypothetical protein